MYNPDLKTYDPAVHDMIKKAIRLCKSQMVRSETKAQHAPIVHDIPTAVNHLMDGGIMMKRVLGIDQLDYKTREFNVDVGGRGPSYLTITSALTDIRPSPNWIGTSPEDAIKVAADFSESRTKEWTYTGPELTGYHQIKTYVVDPSTNALIKAFF